MALSGAERTRAYRKRARERGEAIDTLPPVPQSARAMVAKVICLAILQAGHQVKDQNDRDRLIAFWRSLASSQAIDLGRDRLAQAIERRLRERAAAQELAAAE